MISIIVATSNNGIIGKNNNLLWNIPEDLKRFKKITTGHTIIMGRKTYESIGKPLPNRLNIILSSSIKTNIENAIVTNYIPIEQLLKIEDEIFIVGGEKIYDMFLPYANKIYLTKIYEDYDGDRFFKFNENEFKIIEKIKGNGNYDFITYERRII